MTGVSLPHPRVPRRPGPARPRRVLMVCMPWASVDMPSLALSTLVPLVAEHDGVSEVDVLYANLRWVEYLHERSSGSIGERDYNVIARGDFTGMGEWVFSPALYPTPAPEETPFYALAREQGADLEAPARMFGHSRGFVDELAREIVRSGPDVVGLTTTFDQNIASLALAKRIKELAPHVVTVLGGANCDGSQGAALHRAFGFLDHVVRGEAELVLVELLDALAAQAAGEDVAPALRAISGLCWREDGRSVVNPLSGGMVPMARVPAPRFDEYFAEFHRTRACRDVLPKICVEGGRGCWWGEKHHCTFCGLNGSLMTHRSKPPERMLEEIVSAVREHRALDVVFADNILDMGYLDSLIPDLGETGWDLRLFFEVKSNLGYRQLRALADGGVTQIQPGIENLSSRVLKLMRKGVQGWQNIRFLRDCRSLAIFPSWNFLYGFPGETWDDYAPIVAQLPNLVHLFPPDAWPRVRLTRFSPYFDDPGLGMVNEGPSGLLSSIYQESVEDLSDLVYVFDSAPAGIGRAEGEALVAGLTAWNDGHPGARLVAVERPGGLSIVDERVRGRRREFELTGAEGLLYRDLLKGRTLAALARRAAEAGLALGGAEPAEVVAGWVDAGLGVRVGEH
ncbi:RiPP maturation radical SAM C-methyltransferase, partial [Actinosynnema sp. NPDC059797]